MVRRGLLRRRTMNPCRKWPTVLKREPVKASLGSISPFSSTGLKPKEREEGVESKEGEKRRRRKRTWKR